MIGGICGYNQCTEREILDIDGYCKPCGDYEYPSIGESMDEIMSGANTICLSTCEIGQMITKEGVCEKCQDYTTVSEDGRECITPICTMNEKITVFGTCEACPEFHVQQEDGISCSMITCAANEKLLPTGVC